MSVENPNFESQEPGEIKNISEASSFSELFDILRAKGGLRGSSGQMYSAEDLIRRIETAMGGGERLEQTQVHILNDPLEEIQLQKKYLEQITRTDGLRDKVSELLYKDADKRADKYFEEERERRKGK